MDDQPNADEKLTPNPEHLAKLLEGVEAWNAWMQQDNPITPELRGADLNRRDLAGVDLQDAHLEGAHLRRAHLEGADLRWAHLEGAILIVAHLEAADLGEAHLEGAHLEEADLKGANLRAAHLEEAHLERAELGGADLTGADLRGATFAAAKTDRTDLSQAKWRPEGGGLPDPALYEGLDVRGLRYSDPLFDQFVRQSEFIRRCRETWTGWRVPLFILWEFTCDCGRSIWRWLLACAVVVGGFGLLFLFANVIRCPLVAVSGRYGATWFTHFYFSVVTFSTLGFGDVTPCNWLGEIAVMAEVFLGYLALGGAISIFATKLIPPR